VGSMAVDYSMPVLVVDDYRAVARIIGRLLNQAGFKEVDDAGDAEEALAKMRERKYGLVLSDWHMAPMTGFELLEAAKADEKLRDTTFIMVSADFSPENATAAKQAGASGLMLKPFDAQTLRAKIAGAFR